MRLRSLFVLAAVLAALGSAEASAITYRWSGSFEPLLGDPWNIAPRSTFDVTLRVDREAMDLSGSTPEGRFRVADAQFVIAGIPATTISAGDIRFWDNSSVDGDTLTFFAEIELEGVRAVLGSYVPMPADTFGFAAPRAEPPAWGRTLVWRSGYASAGGSPYQSEVPRGTPVSAVPEPVSGLLWTGVGLAAARSTRRRRVRA